MELVMFVGIPASGKSTAAEQYRKQGYVVLSSDEIRMAQTDRAPLEEMTGMARKQTLGNVFDTVNRRCREALGRGQSVVIDATNLARKRRVAFLKDMSRFPCTKTCTLFITPVETCLERNAKRTGFARVPDRDLHRLIGSFECPVMGEGWDRILPVVSSEPYSFPFEKIAGFPQDNPHHTLTLDAHMAAAEAFCREQGWGHRLERAARFHDIGKLFTKRFENYRGEPTDIAHYYNHESWSALCYLAHMCCGRELTEDAFADILYEAALIGSHMRPMNFWKQSPQVREKDAALFGEDFIQDLGKLHRADRAAH